MRNLSAVDWFFLVLLIIGGINWGLIGLFGFDLVLALFGSVPIIARIIYILVGVSALYVLFALSSKPRTT
ncbi:MAG: DUF378 domain-containing protein [Patescibacteria group bacterium]|jgi:uncharacterized membrane protein YuzA (DUF378 family)